MPKLERVLVVGGGIAGLNVALGLREAGVEVEVHERYDHPQEHATGFTIWAYAIKRLHELGLSGEALDRIGSRLRVTQIRKQSGELVLEEPVGKVSEEKVGAPTYDINRATLQETLTELLGDAVIRGSEVTAIEPGKNDTVSIRLADGSSSEGDLVIGADGIHSVVRDHVAPGEDEKRYSGFAATGAIVEFSHSEMPQNAHVELWGHGSKAGIAWVSPTRVRWYKSRRAKAGAEPPGKDGVLEELDGWWPVIRAAVEATPASELVTTEAWDRDPLSTWVRDRVVLLGDAAHATTPFAAMGACMAIEDARLLVGHLTGDEHIDGALAAFQDSRRKRTEEIVKDGRKMGRVAQLRSPLLAWARDVTFSHTPPEKLEEIAEEMVTGEG